MNLNRHRCTIDQLGKGGVLATFPIARMSLGQAMSWCTYVSNVMPPTSFVQIWPNVVKNS